MNRIAKLGAVMLALVSMLALSACGSSSGRSGADPATVIPASLPVAITVDVPDQAQLSQFRQIVETFGGARAWNQLTAGFNHGLSKNHLSWKQNIAPWIGNQVGFVADDFAAPSAGTSGAGASSDGSGAAVFPTNNMTAALAFAKQATKGSSDVTYAADGDAMLIGTPSLVTQIKHDSTKLSSLGQYAAVTSAIRSDEATVYVNAHAFVNAIEARLTAAQKQQLGPGAAAFTDVPADAAVGIGFNATSHLIQMDVVSHHLSQMSQGSGANGSVAGLPEDAFIAAALREKLTPAELAEIDKGLTDRFNGLGAAQNLPGAQAMSAVTARTFSVLKSILPSYGPLTFALGGTSILGLHGGLSLTPSAPGAGAKLLSTVFNALRSNGSVPVTGTAQDFAISEGPIHVHVTNTAGHVLALLGYTSAAQLTSPTSTLSSAPGYQAALKQLPAGAKVPLYISFSGIAQLLTGLSSSHSQQAQQILHKLSYLAIGHGSGETRVALGLK